MEDVVTVTSKGQIALPIDIREELGVEKGTKMVVIVKQGVVLMKPLKKLSELRGVLADVGKSAKDLVKEVRFDWEKKLEQLVA